MYMYLPANAAESRAAQFSLHRIFPQSLHVVGRHEELIPLSSVVTYSQILHIIVFPQLNEIINRLKALESLQNMP